MTVAVGMCVCWEVGRRADMYPRCGETSSFVHGEVIGTLNTNFHFLFLLFSQTNSGSCCTSWPPPPPPPLTPMASSLSHDFLFPVWLPASPTHWHPWPGSLGVWSPEGRQLNQAGRHRQEGCPPPLHVTFISSSSFSTQLQ